MVTHLNFSAVDDVEVVTLVTLFNNFRTKLETFGSNIWPKVILPNDF